MRLRTRLELDPQPLVDAKRFVNKFNSVVEGTAQETFDELQPGMLEELQWTPGPSKNAANSGSPYRWSNDPAKDANARAYWFVHFPNGRERTGSLGSNWKLELHRIGNALQLVLSNALSYAKWVVGTFDARRDYQLPGHARTGWKPIRQTAAGLFDRFYDEYRRRFNESIPRAWGSVRTTRRNR